MQMNKMSKSNEKEELRKKIIIPTYNQARRHANIYEALVKEFREEGCPTSAKYFQELIDKESSLYATAAIRDRFLDQPDLLTGLFDNCMVAEKAALLGDSNGPEICSNLLLQCILTLQKYKKKYDWIMEDVYKIVIRVCENVLKDENNSKQFLCEIYYKYGTYCTKTDLVDAVKYLQKAFDLAMGTTWMFKETDDFGVWPLYSSVIASQYATTMLQYANNIFEDDPKSAIREAQKAIIIIKGEGIERNKVMYIKAYLDLAEFQIKAKNYVASLKILGKIKKIIARLLEESENFLKYHSRYYHLKGLSYQGLKENEIALVELHTSLEIARDLQMKAEEGNILLDIAKVYIQYGRSQYRVAERCLRESKEIFLSLKDMFSVKKTSYLLASLKVHNIQPMILDLIKYSPTRYCDKHRLVLWKSICYPFWDKLRHNIEEEEKDPLRCLMSAPKLDELTFRRSSFQRKPPKD